MKLIFRPVPIRIEKTKANENIKAINVEQNDAMDEFDFHDEVKDPEYLPKPNEISVTESDDFEFRGEPSKKPKKKSRYCKV